MKAVFILATCRNNDLLPATLLVFPTLRTGFPNAEVMVFDNGNSQYVQSEVREQSKKARTKFVALPRRTTHSEWVSSLITAAIEEKGSEPFYLLDTDVVFWDSFEQFTFDTALAGRQMPLFFDKYTQSWSQPRLHTSLLYVNPAKAREELEASKFPEDDPFKTPRADLIRARWHNGPDGKRLFYDTAALLSYHVSTTAFKEEHLNCFDHMNAGTYVDVLEQSYGGGMVEKYKSLLSHPESLRGIWRGQEKFFASLKP